MSGRDPGTMAELGRTFRASAVIVSLWRGQFLRLTLGLAVSVVSLLAGVCLVALAGGTAVAGRHAVLIPVGIGLTAAIGLRGLGVFRVLLRYAERVATHDAMFRALADLRVWFFRRLALGAAGGLGFRRSADMLSRLVADIEALDAIYLRINVPLISAAVLVPVLLVVLGRHDVPLAVVVAALFAAAAFVVPAVAGLAAHEAGARLAQRGADLRVAVLDTITGLREIRAFGAEGRMLANAQAQESRLIAAQLDLARRAATADAIAFLLGQAALLAVLAAVATGLDRDLPDGLVFSSVAVFLVLASFETASGLPRAGVLAGQAGAAARRVVEAAQPDRAAGPAAARTMPDRAARDVAPGGRFAPAALAFDGVSFSRGPGRDVLHDVSVEIPPGSRVAILGASGAGKSTIAALALRVIDPDRGRITLDGADLRTMPVERLRGRIALLDQATHLFADTIEANLRIGRRDAGEAEIWAALETAAIADWVRAQPDRLGTWLGEGGTRVSGGQGRRLALARALLSTAPILILDEPTTGLDAEAERAFLETLNDRLDGRTVILITHRLTGVERLDRIWRLAGGQLAPAAA